MARRRAARPVARQPRIIFYWDNPPGPRSGGTVERIWRGHAYPARWFYLPDSPRLSRELRSESRRSMYGVLLAFLIERLRSRRNATNLYGRMLSASRSELRAHPPGRMSR